MLSLPMTLKKRAIAVRLKGGGITGALAGIHNADS